MSNLVLILLAIYLGMSIMGFIASIVYTYVWHKRFNKWLEEDVEKRNNEIKDIME